MKASNRFFLLGAAALLAAGCGRSSLLGFDNGCRNGDPTCYEVDMAGDGFRPGDGFVPGDGAVDGALPDGALPDGSVPDGFVPDLGPDGFGDGSAPDGGCKVREDCANGIDDTCDKLIDCQDPTCTGDTHCVKPGQEVCNNNLDDDDDFLVDCADPDCFGTVFCKPADGGTDGGRDGAVDGGRDGAVDGGPVDMTPTCNEANPDCSDPLCKSNPKCVVEACKPEIDFGLIQPHDSKVTRAFDTRGATRTFATCAIPGGTARVGQFTLTAAADVRLDFTQATGSAHVVDVTRAGTGQACDANGLFCLKAGQDPTATHSFANLQPGIYYVIVQSYPGTQGSSTVTLSTGPAAKPEICNNGIDDDGNGLVDCADTACASSPVCIGTQCMPDLNLGAIVVGAPGKSATFDTHDSSNRFHPTCAGNSTGNDEVVRFTLHETAGILLQWSEMGDHVWNLYRLDASGLACDATPVSGCYNPAGSKSGLLAYSPKPAGEYLLVFKALSPSDEGRMNITVSAFQNQQVEICSNGIDDDGNSLVDCEDPACFGVPACDVPICLVDQDLGDFSWGTSRTVTLDTATGNNYYSTTCSKGSGKERVIRLNITQPMALGFGCTQTGSHVLQLAAQLNPLEPCDAHEFNCADPAILPFGCNFAMPNIQPGTYDVIVDAFQAGEEGTVNLTLTGIRETLPEICNNGVDDDNDGAVDCNDKKCVTSQQCIKFQCRADEALGVLPLDGSLKTTVVQTSAGGADQANVSCVTAPGGQDDVIDFQLPAKADVTLQWAQAGNHVLALYTNDSDLYACDAGTQLSCNASMAMPTGTLSLPGLAAGRYHLIVKAAQPGSEGGVVLQIGAVPSP